MVRVLPLFLVFFCLSCGYRLVGTVPEETKRLHLAGSRVYVAPFKNRTDEPNVEYYITNRLVQSLQRTSKIIVVEKKLADYVIEGEVTGYNREVVSLDSSGDVSTYRLNIIVSVYVYDRDGRRVGEFKELSEYEDYRVYDEIEATKAAEREAVENIAQEIAQQIAVLLL